MDADCPQDLQDALQALVTDLPDMVRLIASGGEVLYRNAAALGLPIEGLGHLCEIGSGSGDSATCPACRLTEVLRRGQFERWHVASAVTEGPPAGQRDYYEVTLCPIRTEDGRVCAVIEIIRDETVNLGLQHYLIGRSERQETEINKRSLEQRQLSKRAETLRSELGELRDKETEFLYRDRLSALGQLAGSLAHEIHTPLGAILSSADLIQRSIKRLQGSGAEIEDARIRDAVQGRLERLTATAEVVAEGARRIHGVLRALQNFSRLDEALWKDVDLREGLDSTLQLLQFKMSDRIRVTRAYDEKLPHVTCRPDAINQVFMNLLLNAIQAIPERGEIRVETLAEGSTAIVRISDTGAGIPEAARERIFDLGFTTRGAAGGSGLGLALCRRILEDHGGSIDVQGDPGHGTTFTVRIPTEPSE